VPELTSALVASLTPDLPTASTSPPFKLLQRTYQAQSLWPLPLLLIMIDHILGKPSASWKRTQV
jgi:hypothetical protein